MAALAQHASESVRCCHGTLNQLPKTRQEIKMPVSRIATGVSLYWEEHGIGVPVVLIPPGTRSSSVWKPFQVPELSKRYRVIIYDQRGIGQSEGPKVKYTIPQLAADLMALLDQIGVDRAHVLGHSLGGRVALQAALTWPDRVRSLLLCATGSGGHRGGTGILSPTAVERLVGGAYKGVAERELGDEGWDSFFTLEFQREQAALLAALAPQLKNQHLNLGILLRYLQARGDWDVNDSLADVRVPTVVVVGTGDTVGSNHVEQCHVLARYIPGASLREIEGARHGFFQERPVETNRILLDWLDGNS
jgi:pimeloyl-ACP methyl ester carboxylesterase